MSTIEREVYIQASPHAVAGALSDSTWQAAITVRPEGTGARVRIRAAAAPSAVASALEMAILDDVCGAKRQLEGPPVLPADPHMVGKST